MNEQQIELPIPILRRALSSVLPASATSDKDPSMTGVCVSTDEKGLRFVAHCSHWLARVTTEAVPGTSFRALLPLSYVRKILVLIDDAVSGDAMIVRDNEMIRASFPGVGMVEHHFGAVEIVARDTDGMWPSGPTEDVDTVSLNPALMTALGKAFKAGGSKCHDLRFELRGETDPIVVTSETAPGLSALLMPCADTEEGEEEDPQLDMFGPPPAAVEPDDDRKEPEPVASATTKAGTKWKGVAKAKPKARGLKKAVKRSHHKKK